MRRRAAFWLFPLIAIAVAVFITVFLIQINPSVPKVEISDTDEVLPPKESSGEKSWIEGITNHNDKKYFYPVNEVRLKLDSTDSIAVPEANQTVE